MSRPKREATPRRRVARQPSPTPHPAGADASERTAMIAQAAYFFAEKRQFTPGCELDDWLAAERQIDAELGYAGAPPESG